MEKTSKIIMLKNVLSLFSLFWLSKTIQSFTHTWKVWFWITYSESRGSMQLRSFLFYGIKLLCACLNDYLLIPFIKLRSHFRSGKRSASRTLDSLSSLCHFYLLIVFMNPCFLFQQNLLLVSLDQSLSCLLSVVTMP